MSTKTPLTLNKNLLLALKLVRAGLSPIPMKSDGSPVVDVAEFQQRIPTPREITSMFKSSVANAIVTGSVSGGLEVLHVVDGSLFEEFCRRVAAADEGLIES